MADEEEMSLIQVPTDLLAIENTVDAKARQWLVRIQTNFWQFDAAVRTRVTWFNDQHYNPLRVYEGILPHYEAIKSDLAEFRRYLDDNGFPLNSSYYQYYDAYMKYYDAYADVAKPPALVQEELDKGRIVGICDKVDDGDTIFVNGKEVRLAGIDSAEKGTYSGAGPATARMKELVLGKMVTVYFDPHSPMEMYRRVLGAVYLGNGDEEELYRREDWKSIFVNYIMVDECLSSPNNKGRNMYIDHGEIKAAYEKCKIADLPTMVRVEFKSKPTHAMIFVDGQDTHRITPDYWDMTPGEHEIAIVADGCSSHHETINVSRGKNVIYKVLEPIPTAIGNINIFTTPPDCDIIVNDMPQGVAPIIGLKEVANELLNITAVKEGYVSKTEQVIPVAGRTVTVTFDPLEKT